MHLHGLNLFGIIEEPWPDEPTADELELSERLASAIVKGLEDHIINAVVNDANKRFAHLIWDEIQEIFASDSLLLTFRVWNKWENIQYNFDMAKYIAEMEVSLAEMNSICLDVSGKLVSCGIIGRITNKRPTLEQTLFADLKAVAEPRRLVAKLRDICNHEAVTKRKLVEEEPIQSSSTALSTTSRNFAKKPTRNCKNGHNPHLGHSADDCYFLHPEKKPDWMKKKDQASAYISTPSNPEQEQLTSTSLVRPSFGYNTTSADQSSTILMVLDSGASHHMLNSLAYFQNTVKTLIQITTGNDKGVDKLVAIARGDATLKFENGNTIILKNALQPFTTMAEGIIQPKVMAMTAQIKPVIHDFTLWHNRLGHTSANQIAASLSLSKKFKKLCSFHGDLVGPITPATNGGACYFLTLVDQFTGYIHKDILKEKSKACNSLIDFNRFFEKHTKRLFKRLITDGGGEFCNKLLSDFLKIE
ncbi:hypothetical protein PSTT_07932 [Puccinia striiformis]|uniref:Integrase catalytic domain-containing protein n=1 Tax=Puccinia striiformis TaxID=27350 RepID=A0A2S4VEF9_9BASI|nr:hypothetical protein PSTT_07932 [Puccinia striiformis]